MNVQRIWLLLLLLQNLLLDSLGKALRSCGLRSHRCRPVSMVATHTDFRCPSQGHYALSGDVMMYYKCGGLRYEPCICSCKHEEMCFDPLKRRCRFAFLDSVHNCTGYDVTTSGRSQSQSRLALLESQSDLITHRTAEDGFSDQRLNGRDAYTKNNEIIQRKSSKTIDGESSKVNNEVIKDRFATPTLASLEFGGTSDFPYRDFASTVKSNAEEIQQAAQKAGKNSAPKIIEDDSIFPAWAISLLVLCVVIALVLVVMVLY